jgi:dipeptidyl aminopeptidase/acylaminoacyl peptidase
LKGIKSKILFLPDENHWVLKPQNALVWQREFYKWLKETLWRATHLKKTNI